MISLKACKTCEVDGMYNADEVSCSICGDVLVPLVTVEVAELAFLNARIGELMDEVRFFRNVFPRAAQNYKETHERVEALKGAE